MTTLTIYTMDGCGSCTAAKALLDFKNVEYKQIHVPMDMTVAEFASAFPNVRQFPCIIDENGSYIGALRGLQEYLLTKELNGITL